MKGVVFNLFEAVVTRDHGEDAWDQLLERAGLMGAYTSLGNYADQDLTRLVEATSELLGMASGEVLRWFGREAMPLLAQHYPVFFTPHRSTRPFLLDLNHIIHTEVRKLYPGAEVPFFDFHHDPDGSLLMGYQSARRLCELARGFIEGAARHYGEAIQFEQLSCMLSGDAKCQFRIRFLAEAP